MGVNSLPKTVTQQRHGCNLNPGPSASESSTLTTRLPSHHKRVLLLTRKLQCQSIEGTFHVEKHTHPFYGPFSRTTQFSRYQKGKTNLDFTEARGSGISWAICKYAPCSRQITMPAPHHSVFYRPDALPAAQPTVSKH